MATAGASKSATAHRLSHGRKVLPPLGFDHGRARTGSAPSAGAAARRVQSHWISIGEQRQSFDAGKNGEALHADRRHAGPDRAPSHIDDGNSVFQSFT